MNTPIPLSLTASSFACLLGLLLSGCGSGSQDMPPKEPGAGQLASLATASSKPSVSRAPSSADASKPQTKAPVSSPFTIFYEQDFPGLWLIPMGNIAGIISGAGYTNTLFAVDASGLRPDIDMLKGLPGHTGGPPPKEDEMPPVFAVFGLEGEWPKRGSVFINTPGDRGGTDYMYRLKDGTWYNDKAAMEHSQAYWNAYYLGGMISSTSWKGGDLYEITGEGGHRFIYESKPRTMPVPRIARVAKRNMADENACEYQLALHVVLEGTKEGDLFGLGQLCKDGDRYAMPWSQTFGELAVERWSAGKLDSVVEKLPNAMIRASGAMGVIARSGSDVYVYATVSPDGTEKGIRPYLAHFNGKQWSELAPPEPGGTIVDVFLRDADQMIWMNTNDRMYRRPLVQAGEKDITWERMTPDTPEKFYSIKFAPDGTFWARFGNKLFRRPGGTGNWEAMPLPLKNSKGETATFMPQEIVFWDEDVFVVSGPDRDAGDTTATTALLRLKQGPSLKPNIKKPETKESSALVKAATPACKDVFVVLYKLAKTAPADFDFPLTRDALKGRTEFSKAEFAETIDGGRRYFVAFVPSYDMGRRLTQLIADKVKGSAPQLMCGKPKVSRSLKLDLKTGTVVK